MKLDRKSLIILIVPFIILAVAYFFLPARIPRQFHADGSISYMAREFIFIFGIIPFIIYKRYHKKSS